MCNCDKLNVLNAVRREVQTVEQNNNVLFADNRLCRGCSIRHDEGSGLITLKHGVYRVTFNGNLSSAAAGEVSVAIKLNGEPLGGGIMRETLAAANDLANVGANVLIYVPCDSSATITVGNMLTTAVLVDNANLTVERLGC